MVRGILTSGDLLTTTVDGVDLNIIWNEYQATLSTANTNRSLIASLFTFDTTKASDLVSLDGSVVSFEERSEFGLPKSVQAEPSYTPVGFPLRWFDLAIRYTEDFLRDASRGQLDTQHNAALEANHEMLFRETLRSLMHRTTSATRVVNENGTPIYSLYDGGADSKPPSFAGRSFAPNHQHYLVSGANVVDGRDLLDLTRHIQEHGYGINGAERIVLIVHPQEGETIRGLRIGDTSPYDFIPSPGAPAYLSTEHLVGEQPPAQFMGMPVIGSYGNALVVESYYVPAGYVIASSTSGAGSHRNPLGFRQHVRPDHQGLILKPGTDNRYPLRGSTYVRGFGIGVRNRGAAAVMQIKASGTYDNPIL